MNKTNLTEIKERARKLFKREYMRGQIDRSNGKYSLESLEKRYEKYLIDNPTVLEEFDSTYTQALAQGREEYKKELVEMVEKLPADTLAETNDGISRVDIINLIRAKE